MLLFVFTVPRASQAEPQRPDKDRLCRFDRNWCNLHGMERYHATGNSL